MRATLRAWFALVLLAGLGAAGAQIELVVDGRSVGEVRNDLVPGVGYAPAEALAEGFGARLAASPGEGRVTLHASGRFVQLDIADDADATRMAGATRVDGVATADRAALRRDEGVWLPVRPVAEAFGARVAYLAEASSVVVLTRRASLQEATLESGAAGETVRLRFDAPTRSSRYRNEAWGTWEWRFERVDVGQARTLRGEVFERVDLIPDRGDLLVRVDAGDVEVSAASLPAGSGFELRLRARGAAPAEASEVDEAPPHIVIDPGHGGNEAGLDGAGQREADATLALARRLRTRLSEAGYEVTLTRTGDVNAPVATRSSRGAGADLFLSLHAGELPAGEARLWVLGDAADDEALRAAVRRNARDALDAGVEDDLRRAVLLDLVPDADVGRSYAERIADALFQQAGYRTGEVREAPLAVLDGAAGRGVLLEFAPEDLADDELADVLTEAVGFALGSAGGS